MPEDPDLYCVSTAMHHYAKGVAHAALKNIPAAEAQHRQFYAALKCIPTTRKFFNNPALVTLGVGEKMLDGELAYHRGDYEEAFGHLRESVSRDDDLAYTEPWAWMHPPRHALAALLLEQGQRDEAEAIYRTDLGLNGKLQRCAQHPGNVWSLHGLIECLRMRGDSRELAKFEPRLAEAMAKTDIPITSSCHCRQIAP
jgi:tetratricopeptide (TPR) repeat protein